MGILHRVFPQVCLIGDFDTRNDWQNAFGVGKGMYARPLSRHGCYTKLLHYRMQIYNFFVKDTHFDSFFDVPQNMFYNISSPTCRCYREGCSGSSSARFYVHYASDDFVTNPKRNQYQEGVSKLKFWHPPVFKTR